MTAYTESLVEYSGINSVVAMQLPLSLTDGATLDGAFDPYQYLQMLESINAADPVAPGISSLLAVLDAAGLLDAAVIAYQQDVLESADLAQTLHPEFGCAVSEAALAVDGADPMQMATTSLIDLLTAYDEAGQGMLALIVEAVGAADVALTMLVVNRDEADQLGAAGVASPFATVDQSYADAVALSDVASSILTGLNDLYEATDLATFIFASGEQQTGYVLNLTGRAPSERQYPTEPFNSVAVVNGRLLFANSQGIHAAGGSNDGATPVNWYVKTGKTDYGSPAVKRMQKLYVTAKTAVAIRLKTITEQNGATQEHWYAAEARAGQNTAAIARIDIGKGLDSRFWQYELAGTGAAEIDAIEPLPTNTNRRI